MSLERCPWYIAVAVGLLGGVVLQSAFARKRAAQGASAAEAPGAAGL